MKIRIENWRIEEITGYKPITTFYMDFSIAEKYGVKAIQETFDLAFNGWKSDHRYITELCMVLNWKIWRWYEKNDEFCKLYDKLWKQLDQWCVDNLKDEELEYYYSTTD